MDATPDRAVTIGDLMRGPLDHDGAVIYLDGVRIERTGTYVIPGQKSPCTCMVGMARTDYPQICWKCGGKLR